MVQSGHTQDGIGRRGPIRLVNAVVTDQSLSELDQHWSNSLYSSGERAGSVLQKLYSSEKGRFKKQPPATAHSIIIWPKFSQIIIRQPLAPNRL